MSTGPRDVARRVLGRVDEGEFASAALDDELRRAEVDERDRGLATEITYGVLRYRSRLDRALTAHSRKGLRKTKPDVLRALRVAAYQLVFLDRVPDHAAVNDAANAVAKRGKAVSGFVNGLLRSLARDGEPALVDPDEDVSVACEQHFAMPSELVGLVRVSLADPGQLFAACEALNARPPIWLRPNRVRVSAEQLVSSLEGEGIEATAHQTGAVRIRAAGSPDRSAAFQRGDCAVQDLASQWVSVLAAPASGQRVLDACAGVGGKTAHLAELVGPDGLVHAADRSEGKLAKLRQAAERLGIEDQIRPLHIDLLSSSTGLAEQYDVVVIDAPCTGIGVMRRHPEIKWRDHSANLAQLQATQRELLDRLAPRVARGGALVYSVCSFRAAEGREAIEQFVASHPGFRVDPARSPLRAEPNGTLCTWPHLDDADAFFAARLIRSA